jgi:hypothetical protein
MLDRSYFTVTTFASSVDESQVTLLDSWVGEFSFSLVGEMVFDRRANSVKKNKGDSGAVLKSKPRSK